MTFTQFKAVFVNAAATPAANDNDTLRLTAGVSWLRDRMQPAASSQKPAATMSDAGHRHLAGARTASTEGLLCVPPAAWSEPRLTVRQVILARVLSENCFERSDDPSGIGLGAAIVARYEDHAEVTAPARGYRFVVRRAEVAKVFGDDSAVLGTGERQHFRI